MNFSPNERRLFEEIERRKASREDLCESCDGSGRSSTTMIGNWICTDCLGQGILLTGDEYELMMFIANSALEDETDNILDSEYLN